MKLRFADYVAMGCVGTLVCLFLFFPSFLQGFAGWTNAWPLWSSFVKFAVLATFGECLGLRIGKGVYNAPGFGVASRAVVWGILGIVIKLALVIFIYGTPKCLVLLGLPVTDTTLAVGSFGERLLMAAGISVLMNLIFSPVLMTLHKVTDQHIARTGGSLVRFFSTPINVAEGLAGINWQVQWGFVFKKTVPLFWMPAHIVTFMLPPQFQILYAAALGIVLGVLMAVSSLRSNAAA